MQRFSVAKRTSALASKDLIEEIPPDHGARRRSSTLAFIERDHETSLIKGREGPAIANITEKVRRHKDLSNEKIDNLHEAFNMFPLDSSGKITAAGLSAYYRAVGLIFSLDQCIEMLSLFVGEHTISIDFEEFLLASVRCEKSLSVRLIQIYYFFMFFISLKTFCLYREIPL